MSGTVYGAFRRAAAIHADRPFLCTPPQPAASDGTEPRELTYAAAHGSIEELRARYAGAGYGQGHRVGLLLESRPEFFLHWIGLNALGVSVVPISADWRASELEYVIGHSEMCAAVALPSHIPDLARAGASVGTHPALMSPDLGAVERAPPTPALAERAPDEATECALLYTSGTTGRPKACVLPNEYYLWAGQWYAATGGRCDVRAGTERLITPLPMSHMNAMAYSTMVMLLTGGCIVALDRFHPRTWWDSVRSSRATIVHYLGVMPALLLAAEPASRDREHSVRFGFGAGVGRQHHAAFETRFGFPLLEAWAMTETGAGAVMIANREPRKIGTGCFGKADPHVEYRVVDEEGCEAGPGTPGELLVRSAGVNPRFGFFREYLKDAAATDEAWRSGYFHTGDVVLVDADGDFHFVDRKKNVIRRSGENISAVEVEGVLAQHPSVASVAVTAVPDAVRGDEVFACVVPKADVPATERAALAAALTGFCIERLAYFKAPGYVALCDRLPLTATEKIQRGELRALAQGLLERGECTDTRPLKKRQPSSS